MTFLKELTKEDANIVYDTVFKEYSYLFSLSCLYPSLKQERNIFSITQFTLFMLLLISNTTCLIITISKASDDETILTQSIHFTFMFILSFWIVLTFNYLRSVFARIHRELGEGCKFYDEETRRCVESIKKDVSRQKKIIFVGIPSFVGVCGAVIVVIGPLVDYLTGKVDDEVYTDEGVSLNLPVPCWTPFGSSTMITFILSSLMEAAGHYVIVLSLTASNTSFFFVVQHLYIELNLLSTSVKRINERAKFLFQNRYDSSKEKYEENILVCYNECLKENVLHHQKIIRTCRDLNNLFKYSLTLGYYIGTIMLAISGILLIFGNGHISFAVIVSLMGLGEVAEIFFVCWCGEKITQANKSMSEALYSAEWCILNKEFKSILKIMLIQSQKPFSVYFNVISNLAANLETFANMMNTTYSYFNILYAFREDT